jgi:hypothetical protein
MRLPKIRHWFAVGFLIFTSLISGMYSFLIHPPKILVTNDGAAQWKARMHAVRDRLPNSVQEIGYIADPENLGIYLITPYELDWQLSTSVDV